MKLDHTIVPAHDAEESARFVGGLLGLDYTGKWGHFAPLKVNEHLTFDFAERKDFAPHHYGLLVSDEEFDGALSRLKAASVPHGSAPAKRDGQINTLHEGRGVYFWDANGHSWELITHTYVDEPGKQGRWFVDSRCIGCDTARHWAPGLIAQDEQGRSHVARQPETPEEEASLWRAAVACPAQSIKNREAATPDAPPFPYELTPGVLALGHTAMSSFGAHAYLLPRPGGNLMIDAPRFDAALAERVKALGGIAHVLLTHRDDVAEAAEWAATFGSLVWIHEDERDAAPFATEILSAERPEDIAPGVAWLQTPGHTKGHVAFHVDDAWLFTGDTLHWNPRRDELDVFPKQVFDSWEALAASMDVLAQLRVEWVFAGHGSWQNVGAEAYAEHMKAMGPTMREVGQHPWSHRPGTSFAWF